MTEPKKRGRPKKVVEAKTPHTTRMLIRLEDIETDPSFLARIPDRGDWDFEIPPPFWSKEHPIPALPIFSGWEFKGYSSVARNTRSLDPKITEAFVGLGTDGKPNYLLIFFEPILTENQSVERSVTFRFNEGHWGENDYS